MSDQESPHTACEIIEAVRDQQHVSRTAEQLGRDQKAGRPVIKRLMTKQVGEGRGTQKRQQCRFYR